jgi:superfamily II DNA or RNA helicase
MRLEDVQAQVRITGLAPHGVAVVEATSWIGGDVLKVIFRDASNRLTERLLYRDDESVLELVAAGRPWSFDGDGALLRLVSEAWRIQLAWLFDPYVAITTSSVEPLPHQISAVYEEMLPRQPLRFLLADDPGAGKTIMAGLLLKELMIRGDLHRCLIVSPGSLTEQWQDELAEKFGVHFDILTRDMIGASRVANPFEHNHLLVARMDQLSRSEELQQKLLAAPEWDLIICDEAHRMSGHYFGGEVKLTRRYRLGQTLGTHARNLLLMTATPHSGKEEDFQLFLALLDGDRFEGRFRDGVHVADPSDVMRRLVKEDLYRFDGTPLFPERLAYTAQYDLTEDEARLYAEVTAYVREEMNRVERNVSDADGGGQQRVNVGFALMTLQRRLASSPEAIFRSLKRRRERLEARLAEQRLLLRGRSGRIVADSVLDDLDEADLDDAYEEASQEDREEIEDRLTENVTAAATIEELEIEIDSLKRLEDLARIVVRSGHDAKWNELASILDDPLMIDENGHRRKLVIFSEFRDTLEYVVKRVRNRLARHEAVVTIHGGVTREERRKVVHGFMNDPEVLVLVANDAAGEGVNLQRAHLMVNYDLPWNPNRLEQRFGRIHRIGQREICHLWNLVAKDTREGEVYIRLLDKLDAERKALGGKVYDVLGQLFDRKALRDLLMEAIRYGTDPVQRDKMARAVDGAVDHARLVELLERRALVQDTMDTTRIRALRDEMERAHARRLQPHYVQALFLDAFRRLGGQIHPRESGRWEITHVPQPVRERDRHIGRGAPVLKRYERVCFDKSKIDATPRAELVCPGSPLLDAVIDLTLERHGQVLRQGAVLVDESDPGTEPRLLFYLEHAVHDGRRTPGGDLRVVSKRLQFAEVDAHGQWRTVGAAPYLDYRPAEAHERKAIEDTLDAPWLREQSDDGALRYAIQHIVPAHAAEVRTARIEAIDRVAQQVKDRLTKEVQYWDRRAQDQRDKERAGKPTRLPARVAEERADKLAERLQARLAELDRERHIVPGAPVVRGGALIVPVGALTGAGGAAAQLAADAAARRRVELIAMAAVMEAERQLGRAPRDVSATHGLGYDVESREGTGSLYFIEVKGRVAGADSVTLTVNEIRRANNVPDRFILAIVEVEEDRATRVTYVRGADYGQPGFTTTSVNFHLPTLLAAGAPPS